VTRITLVFCVCLAACGSDAGGPRPVTIGARVTDESDVDEAKLCIRLPVLLGSRVKEVREVPSGFQIEMSAARDWVEVRFPGADADVLRGGEAALEGGYSAQTSIVDDAGVTHTGYVFTGCALEPDETE
jgi:hypothetical protein